MIIHINGTAKSSLDGYTKFKLTQILLDEVLLDITKVNLT